MGAYAHAPAKAADLGGDCCSDLEDRVAELEATTVRKGNKKVSVTIYGQVNRAVLWWNDHVESNTYAGIDNNYESSRFGLKGSAKITGDWSAGYRLEVEPTFANSARLNQFNDDNANDPLGPLNVRWSQIYINNKQYGEVRLGLTGTPIYNITKASPWGEQLKGRPWRPFSIATALLLSQPSGCKRTDFSDRFVEKSSTSGIA